MNQPSKRRYGVRQAKAHLSELLQDVRQGAEILITDRGRPVGKLVPVVAADLSQEERLADLVARGFLSHPKSRDNLSLPPLIEVPEGLAQRFLAEDREDRI